MTVDTLLLTCQAVLAVSAIVALVRALVGPTITDRIIAVDLVLLMLAGGVGIQAARDAEPLTATVAVVVALLAFAGTVLVARYIEWQETP